MSSSLSAIPATAVTMRLVVRSALATTSASRRTRSISVTYPANSRASAAPASLFCENATS